MKWGAVLVSLALLVASCGSDRHVGERYRAERDLWRANWEYRSLMTIRPQEVSDDRWVDLAYRYEAIANRYTKAPEVAGEGSTQRDVQTIAATALFSAAQIHALVRDSTRMETLFDQMARDFGHVPEAAAELALSRGMIAERNGELAQAARFYQVVVDRIDPAPGETGPAGMVLELPLRIARLHAQADSGSSLAALYAPARSYYEGLIRDHAGDPVQIESQSRLAEIAANLGNWEGAMEELRLLETQLLELDDPPLEPCEVRFAISGILNRAGADPESTRVALVSVLEDYPDCGLAPQVLMALAGNATERDQIDEALGYLDRISEEHDEDEEAASRALLMRARLLEAHERWPDALDAYRSLSVQHPISEAALLAPLEIAQHYLRVGDEEARTASLTRAEREYRDFIDRFRRVPTSVFARERLVQTLALQEKFDSAVTEMVSLGDDLTGTPRGATLLIAAAKMAHDALADTVRAAEILDHAGELYAKADVGKWASSEAERLRGTMSR